MNHGLYERAWVLRVEGFLQLLSDCSWPRYILLYSFACDPFELCFGMHALESLVCQM